MTPRQNALAILHGETPEYCMNVMEAIEWAWEPMTLGDDCPRDGLEHQDTWGTVNVFPPREPGQIPVTTPDKLVIPDIEEWEKYLKVPSLEGFDWTEAEADAKKIDRTEKFVGIFCATGIFERSHFLMGFENTLCNLLMYPDEMAAVMRKIADYKLRYFELIAEHVHPDVVFYQDDWGSKNSLFFSPSIWREIIKPLEIELVEKAHSLGMIFIHHADCFCEPLAPEMEEIGIDIWQGVIPQNDIVSIQKKLKGTMALQGGIDAQLVDSMTATEAQIRAEVRRGIDTYCPGGKFFPGMTGGTCYIAENGRIMLDELHTYGRSWAAAHYRQ